MARGGPPPPGPAAPERPRNVFPRPISAETSTGTGDSPNPTNVSTPRGANASIAVFITPASPVVSSACVAPPFPNAEIRPATSGSFPSTTTSAPNSRANSNRSGDTSTATTVPTPIARAASSADIPTPPAPKIANTDAESGRNTSVTAPAPVCTAHPNAAARTRSTSSSTTTTLRAVASTCEAKLDCPKNAPVTGSSPARNGESAPNRPAFNIAQSAQYPGTPAEHSAHTPQL